jgi:hypothetical protein
MKERPILFNAPMVRALLAGTKTQTRRVVKPQPREGNDITSGRGELAWQTGVGHFIVSTLPKAPKLFVERCPYGRPGDRLWVRETFTAFDVGFVTYRADFNSDPAEDRAHGIVWTPSIHMPRWASRILLEIVSVRVERLQDISEADAMAEGITVPNCGCGWGLDGDLLSGTASGAYMLLWESINGHGSWDANPWVWVVEFKRVQA